MEKVYIVAAQRTAIGKFQGCLSDQGPVELGYKLLQAILQDQAAIKDHIDEVIVGNVLGAGHGQNIGRQISLKAGLDCSVPAYSLNMVCGSGLKAVAEAYYKIKFGLAHAIIAGGVESMSQAALLLDSKVRKGSGIGHLNVTDSMLQDGLTDAFSQVHMGITAENIAQAFDISRQAQDEFALNSQLKARKAKDTGKFEAEIVPISWTDRKGQVINVDQDEYINYQPIPFELVPLIISTEADTFIDDQNLDIDHMLTLSEASKSPVTTACPSPDTYAQTFVGAENIICFTLSANISGSYNSACLAAQLVKETNPHINIHIFDTHTAGNEADLLIYKALELAKNNLDFDQMIASLEAYHQTTDTVFLLEKVNNLVKNGRVNKLLGTMIGLLGIRLIGVRLPEGIIELGNKAKGEKRGLKTLVETMLDKGYKGKRVSISHAFNPSAADKAVELIKAHYPHAQISINLMSGLCSFYAERNGLIIGFEK